MDLESRPKIPFVLLNETNVLAFKEDAEDANDLLEEIKSLETLSLHDKQTHLKQLIRPNRYLNKTALMIASENKDVKMVEILLHKLPRELLDQTDSNGKTALFYACDDNVDDQELTKEVVKVFLEFQKNVSVVKDNEKLNGLMKVNELVALLTKGGHTIFLSHELYMSPKAKKCILSHEFTSNVAGCHNNIEFKHAWEECCKVFSMENLDLKEVLQTMRHHSQPVTFLASERDITERENMLGKLAFDNVLSLHYLYKKRFLEENHDAMIPLCRYTNVQHMEDKFKCEEFKWSLTNAGFGITFNAADFWSIYKPTKYLKIFKEEMRPKGYSLSNQESSNENVFHTKQVGRAKDLLFIVQRSKFEDPENPFSPAPNDKTMKPTTDQPRLLHP